MIIKNGTIHDAVNEASYLGDIRIAEGKITEIALNLTPEENESIFDAEGKHVYPGFIDAHSHIGLDPFALGRSAKDYNETTEPLTPQLRGIDSFNPMDEGIANALAGGVTTVGTGPGSSNVLCGTFFAVKLFGKCVDDIVIKNPVAMKCAFGENPKMVYTKKGVSVRMTTAAKLRDSLYQAKDYLARKEAANGDAVKVPKYDMKMEALIPVLKKEIPLKAHAHRADDILTAIRIAKEFDVDLTIEHCTEGHLITDKLVEAGYPVIVGPSFLFSSKPELRYKSFKTAGILAKAGLQVSIMTDAPAVPQEYLALMAGLSVKAGMDPFDALKAITINPAKHLGIADRVGSIEIGKDADIVITDGDPLVSSTYVLDVFVNGELAYDYSLQN